MLYKIKQIARQFWYENGLDWLRDIRQKWPYTYHLEVPTRSSQTLCGLVDRGMIIAVSSPHYPVRNVTDRDCESCLAKFHELQVFRDLAQMDL